jgi:RHS repeat-associated protein
MVYDIFGQQVADYTGTGSTLERENIYRFGQLLTAYEAATTSWRYVLTDAQGSTRAVMNNNGGSSSIVARHDYLPFGEEIGSGIGLRTTTQNYGASDLSRQMYGLLERDQWSGLDHTTWRDYESSAGRWVTADPYRGSMAVANPQSFNRYSYVQNDPLNLIDPSGLDCFARVEITTTIYSNGHPDTKSERLLFIWCEWGEGPTKLYLGGSSRNNPGVGIDRIDTYIRRATPKEEAKYYDDKRRKEEAKQKAYKDCMNDAETVRNAQVRQSNRDLANALRDPISTPTKRAITIIGLLLGPEEVIGGYATVGFTYQVQSIGEGIGINQGYNERKADCQRILNRK